MSSLNPIYDLRRSDTNSESSLIQKEIKIPNNDKYFIIIIVILVILVIIQSILTGVIVSKIHPLDIGGLQQNALSLMHQMLATVQRADHELDRLSDILDKINREIG